MPEPRTVIAALALDAAALANSSAGMLRLAAPKRSRDAGTGPAPKRQSDSRRRNPASGRDIPEMRSGSRAIDAKLRRSPPRRFADRRMRPARWNAATPQVRSRSLAEFAIEFFISVPPIRFPSVAEATADFAHRRGLRVLPTRIGLGADFSVDNFRKDRALGGSPRVRPMIGRASRSPGCQDSARLGGAVRRLTDQAGRLPSECRVRRSAAGFRAFPLIDSSSSNPRTATNRGAARARNRTPTTGRSVCGCREIVLDVSPEDLLECILGCESELPGPLPFEALGPVADDGPH